MSFPSTVSILIGQCGNQLGSSFLDRVAHAAQRSSPYGNDGSDDVIRRAFFHEEDHSANNSEDAVWARRQQHRLAKRSGSLDDAESPTHHDRNNSNSRPRRAKAVLVDMESKAVDQCRKYAERNKTFAIAESQCVCREEGSGNNWSFGYFCQGESRLADIAECIRKQVEEDDDAAGGCVRQFHVVHSIAGGTGSGVGCLVSELLRDTYPKCRSLHSIVWPFHHGEVVTQWFNAALATSFLRDTADGVFVASNDDAVADLRGTIGQSDDFIAGGIRGASNAESFLEINRHISAVMASLWLPSFDLGALASSLPPNLQQRHGGSPQGVDRRAPMPYARRRQYDDSSVGGGGGGATSSPARAGAAGVASPLTHRYSTLEDVLDILDPVKKFFCGSIFPRRGSGALLSGAGANTLGLSWHTCTEAAVRCLQHWRTERYRIVLRGPAGTDGAVRDMAHSLIGKQGIGRYGSCGGTSIPFDGTSDVHAACFGVPVSFADRLQFALEKAEAMLDAQAYFHHLARYGLEQDDMDDAMLRCWEVVQLYRSDRHCD